MRALPVTADVLDPGLLREIARQGGVRSYPAQSILINEGDSSDSLFIVLSGRVKVYSNNADGKEIVITTHGAGEYVGELALDGGVRSASVMTLEPTTCSVVSGANLREFVAAHPDFALAPHPQADPLGARGDRERQEPRPRGRLRARRPPARRALRSVDGRPARVRERLTQQDIADRVGASREMVSRIFKDLTTGGYIDAVERADRRSSEASGGVVSPARGRE
jgi:CRP/FNR family cyclic AMP-dependent transcriptional regulator